MDNWNDSDFKIPKSAIPKAVFEGVKKQMITRRIEAQQNRRQLAIGSVLLLILGAVNIGILMSYSKVDTAKTSAEQAEILHKAYFQTPQNPLR